MLGVQQQLNVVMTQLKGLSPTSRLLIGSLMIILVMTLFLVAQYTARPTMVPLPVSLTADTRAKALTYLQTARINHEDTADGLLVPADQQYSVLAQMTQNDVISGEQIDFNSIIENDSPFRDRESKRKFYLIAKMNVLGNMISQMEGIEWARVLIDQPDRPTPLGSPNVAPSASVTVRTSGAELSQSQVDAIAQLVAGSHASLQTASVAIVDARTGVPRHARTDESGALGQHLELQRNMEKYYERKLRDQLSYIPGVLVTVSAAVDSRRIVEHRMSVEDPKIGVTSESTRSVNSSREQISGEPGVRPNTGTTLVQGGGHISRMSDEQAASTTVPVFPTGNQTISDPRGFAQMINASIGVPKSYYVRLHQDKTGDPAAQPDQAAIDELANLENERIRKHLTPLIDTSPFEGAVPGSITVSMVADFALASAVSFRSGEGGGVGSETGGIGGGILNDGLVKYVGLGALAFLSLAMMFMMVRKASSPDDMPTAEELVGIPPALAAAESELVGEAEEDAPALEGLEVDDDEVQQQQMLDQINEMILANPGDAATLVRKWVRRDR